MEEDLYIGILGGRSLRDPKPDIYPTAKDAGVCPELKVRFEWMQHDIPISVHLICTIYFGSHRFRDVSFLEDERTYCQMLETAVNIDGYYYSTEYDLTHSQQRLSNASTEFKKQLLYQRADERFVWNGHLLKIWSSLLENAYDKFASRDKSAAAAWSLGDHCLPIMQGFVAIITSPRGLASLSATGLGYGDDKTSEFYALISRRSQQRVGTRYNCRGIDQFGNVVNTIETEQLVSVGGHHFSFVQLRGSIPLFWSQQPNLRYKPSVLMGGSQLSSWPDNDEASVKSAQSAIARHHFNQLVQDRNAYGSLLVLVNLVNQHGMERPLGREFALATVNLENVKYESFDFHRECGATRWDRLSILLDRLKPDLTTFKQFHVDTNPSSSGSGSKLISPQSGTFRTNCIDSLDRTNVVQSMLAWMALEYGLVQCGLLVGQDDHASSSIPSDQSPVARSWSGFLPLFKSVWADNADMCALQYTGTPALKTDFTRTGKRTLWGMLMDGYHSGIRYYKNNFTDGQKQDAMYLLLGRYSVHDADGRPKTLIGGRRGGGSGGSAEWRSQFLPLVFGFTLAMSVLFVFVPTARWTEKVAYLMFWATSSIVSLSAIIAHGDEFVDRPRLQSD